MTAGEAYAIVVRSSGDPDRAADVLSLLPDAFVYIDEREREEYESAIAPARIRTHDSVVGEAAQLNALQDAFEEPALIVFTDAFAGLRIINHDTGRYGPVVRDTAILVDIIENTLQCAIDAGVGVFRWAPMPDTKRYSACDPLVLSGGMFYPVGMRGAARHRRFNTELPEKHDVAWSIETMTQDRIILADTRFCFDHGPVDMEHDVFVRRRGPEVDGDMEYKVLVDAGDEATLARLYEEMVNAGLEAKLIT